MQDWDSLEKPWTKEQCRDRYVQGSQIGLRKLAEVSGRRQNKLFEWSRKSDWPKQRKQFQSESQAKRDEAAGDAIAARNAEILSRHYANFFDLEILGMSIAGIAQQCADSFANQDSPDPYRVQALASAASQAGSVLTMAIKGQAEACGLAYEDLNAAIVAIRRGGMVAISADDYKSFQRFLVAQESGGEAEYESGTPIVIEAEDVSPTP